MGDARVPRGAPAGGALASDDAPDRGRRALPRAVRPGADRGALDADHGRREGGRLRRQRRAGADRQRQRDAEPVPAAGHPGRAPHPVAACSEPPSRSTCWRSTRRPSPRPPSGIRPSPRSRSRRSSTDLGAVRRSPPGPHGLGAERVSDFRHDRRPTVPVEIVGRADAFPGMLSRGRSSWSTRNACSTRSATPTRSPARAWATSSGSAASRRRPGCAGRTRLPAVPHPHRRRGEGHLVHRGGDRHVPRDERARLLAAALLVFAAMLMYLQTRQRSEIVSYGLSLRMGMRSSRHLARDRHRGRRDAR